MKLSYLLIITIVSLLFNTSQAKSPYEAARSGDLEALRQYRFEGIDLYMPDERGFIPYELAALHADPEDDDELERHVEMMLWLKEFNAAKHVYTNAANELIQAGLNALGYPVGVADGVIGERTIEVIKRYQRDNNLAETGRPGPQWLGMFYQDSVKDVQYKLSKLGYGKLSTDGIMGAGTRASILKYREENNLAIPQYQHLDGLLISSIDKVFNEKENKKQKVLKIKERDNNIRKTRYVQSGLRTLGYRIGRVDGMSGSQTSNAIKSFQRKNKLEVTGEVDDKTKISMRKAFAEDTQKKLNAIGYNVGEPDGLLGKRSIDAIRNYRVKQGLDAMGGIDSDMIQGLQSDYANARTESEQKAEKSKRISKKVADKNVNQRIRFAQAGMRTLGYGTEIDGHSGEKTNANIKRFQKKYKLKRTGKTDSATYEKMQSIFLKETQRKLNVLGYENGLPDGKIGPSITRAIKKFTSDKKMPNSSLNSKLIAAVDDAYDNLKDNKKNTKKIVRSESKRGKTSRRSSAGGRSVSGRLSFKRRSGRVIGCTISGRYIPIEWCEPFYPLSRNNRCKASFKSNGAVINLLCK